MRDLMIGYPHAGMVHEPFMRSLLEFQFHDVRDRGVLHSACGAMGPSITDNRNRICRRVLSCPEVQWLLFVDTDICFKPEQVYRLLDHQQKIVTGLYFGRPGTNEKLVPLWYECDNRIDDFNVRIVEHVAPELKPIEACGMGFCLIHRSVLEAFPNENDDWRWFSRDVYSSQGKHIHISEDLSFCLRARQLGFEVYGDGTLALPHIKATALTLDKFLDENGITTGVREPARQNSVSAGGPGVAQPDDVGHRPAEQPRRNLGPQLIAAAVRNGTVR